MTDWTLFLPSDSCLAALKRGITVAELIGVGHWWSEVGSDGLSARNLWSAADAEELKGLLQLRERKDDAGRNAWIAAEDEEKARADIPWPWYSWFDPRTYFV